MIDNNFLNPKAIAIVGASAKVEKIGHQIVKNIIFSGFSGAIYPVNPRGGRILGKKVFSDLESLPIKNKKTTLIVLAVPADISLLEARRAGQLGFKNLVIISAGFKESGLVGKKREEELLIIANKYRLRILGPNCLGFINQSASLNLTFARSLPIKTGRRSGIAFISQSGALGSAILDRAIAQKMSFELFVSLGNKSILTENNFLLTALNDKSIKAVFLYLEEISQGPLFINIVSRLALKKPVFILKSGRSDLGRRSALSHTGSLAGSEQAVEIAIKRAGAIRLDSLDDLWRTIDLFRPSHLSGKKENSLVLVSNAGGPAVLSADLIASLGFDLPSLGSDLCDQLKRKIPSLVNCNNPLDILGDADPARYKKALELILQTGKYSHLLLILTAQTATNPLAVAKDIARLSKKYPHCQIFTSFIGGHSLAPALDYLLSCGIANFPTPEEALRAWHKINLYQNIRAGLKKYPLQPIQTEDFSGQPVLLDYLSSLRILRSYNIDTVKTVRLSESARLNLRFPLVLKAVGPYFNHKSDKRAVILNIKNPAELRVAKRSLEKGFRQELAKQENYLIIQEMLSLGQEVIIGFKRDVSFGPILMVGLGGIYAEFLKDVQFSLIDIDFKGALALLKKLKIYPAWQGARGQHSLDIKSLARALVSLARLAKERPDIIELDINPVFLGRNGLKAADVRIIYTKK